MRKTLAITLGALLLLGCSQGSKETIVPDESRAPTTSTAATETTAGEAVETTTTGVGIKAPMPTVSQEGFAGKMRVALDIERAMRDQTIKEQNKNGLYLGDYTYDMAEMLYSGFDPRDAKYLNEALNRVGSFGNMSVTVYTTDGKKHQAVVKGEKVLGEVQGKIDALEVTDGLATACHWMTSDTGSAGVGLRGECSESR